MGTNNNFYNQDRNLIRQKLFLYNINNSVEEYVKNTYLKGNNNRIVYSDNAYAFRQRSKQIARLKEQELNYNNYDLPFINYKVKDVVNDSEGREWFNQVANVRGVFISELGRNIRLAPVTINYEATLWVHTNDDLFYGNLLTMFDNSNETYLQPELTIDGYDIPFYAGFGYNLGFDTEYQQQDWLERNKIHNIAMDWTVVTYFPFINDGGYEDSSNISDGTIYDRDNNYEPNPKYDERTVSIIKKAILEFKVRHTDITDDSQSITETVEVMDDYFACE
jgi:hypothetical protein